MTTRIDAFAEQAKLLAEENNAMKETMRYNLQEFMELVAKNKQLQVDKAELLEGLKYCLPHIVGARKIGDSAYKIAEAIITKHSGAGETG